MADQFEPKKRSSVFQIHRGAATQNDVSETVTDLNDLTAFVISTNATAQKVMKLHDSNLAQPCVLTQCGHLLKVDDPTDNEASLIPSMRDRLIEVNNGSVVELRVNRSVLRSFIANDIDRQKASNSLKTHPEVESIVRRAVNLSATDIHLVIVGDECNVRYRVNGILAHPTTFSHSVGTAIISAWWETYAMIPINGDIAKDGRYSRTIDGVSYLFRLSLGVSKATETESLAVRLRNMRDIPKIADLGYNARQLELVKECLNRAGVALICGQVNSGKSTLQSAWMAQLPDDLFKLEVSDQVEVLIDGWVHLQKLTTGTRERLVEQTAKFYQLPTRHDINFIAVNEVRNHETAQLLEDLMQQGTSGISSIHAKGWPEAINRMLGKEMAIRPESLFAEGFFNAIVYQTLGRVLCAGCKLDKHGDAFWTDYFRVRLGDGIAYRNPNGCEKCAFTGIAGLTAVAEFIPIRHDNRHLLKDTTNTTAMYRWMRDNNIPTIFQHALEKIKARELDPHMIRQILGDFDETNIFDEYLA